MKTKHAETGLMTVITDVVVTFKYRIIVLSRIAFFSVIIAGILVLFMSIYAAFPVYINWMLFGIVAGSVAHYLIVGHWCEICEKAAKLVVCGIRFVHRNMYPDI